MQKKYEWRKADEIRRAEKPCPAAGTLPGRERRRTGKKNRMNNEKRRVTERNRKIPNGCEKNAGCLRKRGLMPAEPFKHFKNATRKQMTY
ncbi:MAG: hypothetical protein IJH99_03180 [Eubacterium sp.]|nr:hypothetical protein [Eubacterium sp.]